MVETTNLLQPKEVIYFTMINKSFILSKSSVKSIRIIHTELIFSENFKLIARPGRTVVQGVLVCNCNITLPFTLSALMLN